jgi:hypothetical protein
LSRVLRPRWRSFEWVEKGPLARWRSFGRLERGSGGGYPAWLRPMADALGIRFDQIQTMVHFSQFVW